MANRYVRQFDFTNTVSLPSCPVLLEKGAVLLDTKSNTYFLQLKFANISTADIESIYAYAEALDANGDLAYPGLTPGIACDYNEVTPAGGTLGTKKLLPLPNNNAVSFRIFIEKVITSAGHTYTFERVKYTACIGSRDIAYERDKAFKVGQDRQLQEMKMLRTKWSAVWYHGVFAISLLLSTILVFRLLSFSF